MRWPEKLSIRFRWGLYRLRKRLRYRRLAASIKRDPYPARADMKMANEIIDICNRLLLLGVKRHIIEAGLHTAWRKAKRAGRGASKRKNP